MENLVEMNGNAIDELIKSNGVDLNNNNYLMLQMLSNMQREQSEMKLTSAKNATDISDLKIEIKDFKADYDKKTNVLGSFGCYGSQLSEITLAVKRKAAHECGGFETDLFEIFGRSVITDIYSHIYKAMGISKIGQLNMKDYEQPGSDFMTALKIIGNYHCQQFFFTSHLEHYQRQYDNNKKWRMEHGTTFERYVASL